MSNMENHWSWINQWPAILALGEGYNWVNFSMMMFLIEGEYKKYAGNYWELTVIVLGLGFRFTRLDPDSLPELDEIVEEVEEHG